MKQQDDTFALNPTDFKDIYYWIYSDRVWLCKQNFIRKLLCQSSQITRLSTQLDMKSMLKKKKLHSNKVSKGAQKQKYYSSAPTVEDCSMKSPLFEHQGTHTKTQS